MKKNNGFTLIELLAVIVILAIISIIAVPIVLNIIDTARRGSAESSANGYINAVEYYNTSLELKNLPNLEDGSYDVNEIDVKLDGSHPTYGTVTIENNGIVSANLCIDGYEIDYKDGKSNSNGKCRTILEPKVGDYIRMTPTLTSFETDVNYTGYYKSQTFYPEELDLWRIIKVNDDGTAEMVSVYVSSKGLYLEGQTGYKNFIGYLNEIASKYENKKYTISSRHIGYNGQTEYLTDTLNTVDSTIINPPYGDDTLDNVNEVQGGGDVLYLDDVKLINNIMGTLIAETKEGTTPYYWLASRYYHYTNDERWSYNARYLTDSGTIENSNLYGYKEGFNTKYSARAIRPMVTIKENVRYSSGTGTRETPFVLD